MGLSRENNTATGFCRGLLGDLEAAGLAGSKRRHSVPAPSGRRLRS
ncbi:hypothetical protein HMPREF0539_1202 [Lacticaseibacillus rhamnosus LMS2-1]|uniref:Uncharacterized protein n=1 Tax=Lacticaseibacillus rhamnosus (strain LMS2-1) TaxID=525361 RepID=C2JWB8_LACRM|nr:hypothetical protein HMPREF0539_1202 [Lacticaseibacillus rhamnosus LMS2-1]